MKVLICILLLGLGGCLPITGSSYSRSSQSTSGSPSPIKNQVTAAPQLPFGSQAPTGQKVYGADECIGPVIMGRCHGAILPKKAYHPTCYGSWLNGQCIGPMF